MDIEKINQYVQIAMYFTLIIGAVLLVVIIIGRRADMIDSIDRLLRVRFWQWLSDEVS